MTVYADTSLMFSLYASDAHSPKADIWRQAHPASLPFTAFHRLELRNALNLAVFQQRLTPAEIHAAWQEVENDLAAGLLVAQAMPWQHVLAEAEAFAAAHTSLTGCRTLDVIHVATARIIGATEFCSLDARQSNLAGRVGLAATSP